jgi:hypothetical protein
MPASPTSRTLQKCKALGWLAYVTEKRIPKINILKDAFGFGDVLAMDGLPGSLLIQATSTPNMASRETKIREHCWDAATRWLDAGNRIQVWGWAKRGAAGKRKLWTLRIVEVTL